MPIFEFFLALEGAGETAAAAEAATTATEAAAAADAAAAAEAATSAAAATSAGITAAEAGAGAQAITTEGIKSALAQDVATGGAGAAAPGINAYQVGAEQSLATAPGAGVNPAGVQPLQYADAATTTSDAAQYNQDKQILDMMNKYNAAPPPAADVAQYGIKVPGAPANSWTGIPDMSGQIEGIYPGLNSTTTFNPNLSYSSQVTSPYNLTNLTSPDIASGMSSVTSTPLESGFDKALAYMEKHPFQTGVLGVGALNLLGAFSPKSGPGAKSYSGSLSKFKISPDFQGYTPRRPNPYYRPSGYAAGGIAAMAPGGIAGQEQSMYPQSMMDKTQYATPTQMPTSAEVVAADYEPKVNPYTGEMQYASGGIASYARGREVKNYMDIDPTWQRMIEGDNRLDHLPESVGVPRTGIVYDTDPDTRYKDALTATHIRMGKINKKASVPTPSLDRPAFALGQINVGPMTHKKETTAATEDDREAAAGGIMQADRYSMGGYASGSVPRLLKGPGDGMSDDIPASIDGRQPARLADGEFVIPADVVSGLGNGSTDAGAKHLHKMMTDVRKARTGNPKQGKQIVAQKFIPRKGKA